MKAVVVRQPWATLIALGIKTIETRPAPPNGPMRPDGVRGLPGCSLERGERIAIVAGARVPPRGECCGDWSVETWRDSECEPCAFHLGLPSLTDGHRNPISLPLGEVVGTAVITDALPIVDDRTLTTEPNLTVTDRGELCVFLLRAPSVGYGETDQLPLGDFTPGRWGWLLSDPQPCDPIPCKGKQGVFVLPAHITEQIGEVS